MTRIARDKKILKRRVEYYLHRNVSEMKNILSFVGCLSCFGDVYIFGGMLRDIALGGGRNFKSDFDLVFVSKSGGLDVALSSCDNIFPKINKFGGYRLVVDGVDVDVWSVEDTWAFRCKKKEYVSVVSILDTTITNWDAILYSFSDRKIICKDGYFKDLIDGYLDMNFLGNPNEIGALVKVIRAYTAKHAETFSVGVLEFVKGCFDKYTYEDISLYERRIYKENTITFSIYKYIIETPEMLNLGILPVKLDRINRTKSFFSGGTDV
jgi:hypothetical protein